QFEAGDAPLGKVTIEADNCAFGLDPTGAVLRLWDVHQLDRVLGALSYAGEGSLLSPRSSFALRYDEQGRPRPVDDERVEVDGLVLTDFQFAELAAHEVASSAVVRWSAPLQTEAPPGARPDRLHLPNLVEE